MKARLAKRPGLALVLALSLLGSASTAIAHGTGMMSGSMMDEDGKGRHGWGEHGYGMGYGWMMGPGMMGPGMMGGAGMMGPGMMGGCGPMHGGDGMAQLLGLSDDQQQQIAQIHQELRKKHWDRMGTMHEGAGKLRQLYLADKRNPDAILEQQQRLFELRQEMTRDWLEAQNRIEDLLTAEQKEKLQQHGQHGMMGW
ncbi:hypothetical protein GCM10011348_10480 [Marinobacterium nitratireducens]|uniref:Zinc resistance-associated protein n=1 Tax=Marinobacterium nitratireducens TaxID=518897 RepID=A0A917ZBM9_9GAMM|nr:Spy/CpxP family protein refolding chaperone [Marinobacterium nitratireducens]GGO78477.1 hypothetical protein GCM10011348_10480 [Marinobacterium nitratireducens]